MISPPTLLDRHLRWSAERFYWAVLDEPETPTWRTFRSQHTTQRLGYLFENVLPGIAIEELHAVYQQLPGSSNRILACGVPRAVLENDVDQSTLTLTPQAAPCCVDERVDLSRLNVLTGAFVPKAVRHLRQRWLLHVCVIATLCAAFLVLGLERRIGLHHRAVEDLKTAQGTITRQILGTSVSIPGAGMELRLTAERRRLEQTRSDILTVNTVKNASPILAQLLTLWPQDLHVQTQTLTITASSITVRATVPTMSDAQELADALAPLDGWNLQQPQSESRRGHVDVTLRFELEQEQGNQ